MKSKIIGLLAIVGMLAAFAPASMALASDGETEDEDELSGVIESLPASADFVGDWIEGSMLGTYDTEVS